MSASAITRLNVCIQIIFVLTQDFKKQIDINGKFSTYLTIYDQTRN